jgi:Na+(H+)/acetate symporter ActP
VFLVVGIGCGLVTTSITSVMMWLVGALYSAFVAANVLKWYWWRFNGYGYFWGMISGILGAVLFWVAGEGGRAQLQRALHLPLPPAHLARGLPGGHLHERPPRTRRR